MVNKKRLTRDQPSEDLVGCTYYIVQNLEETNFMHQGEQI